MKYAFGLLLASVVTVAGYRRHHHHPRPAPVSAIVYPCPGCPPRIGPPAQTVTKQYQTVSTCQANAWGKPESCSNYAYVSTVIPGWEGNLNTVTKTDQAVTVCHTKSTITHSDRPAPTGHSYGPYSNGTSKVWYELYEKICEVSYNDLGPIALPGYGGSGLCGRKCYGKHRAKYQPVEIKECHGGKCIEYAYTYTHGAPKPSVTTYAVPGTYAIPSCDVTVVKPTTVPTETRTWVRAHKRVTYGGVITSVPRPTTITAAHCMWKKQGRKTKAVIKYVTRVCPSAGKYTIVKPTVTSYKHATIIVLPTAHVYWPGVYHHSREIITITRPHQPYTCHFTKTEYPSTSSTSSTTTAPSPDPSSDYDVVAQQYGRASAGRAKRGGMIKRMPEPEHVAKGTTHKKRVILV